MGVLSLFRIRVVVNLCWEAGACYLVIYEFSLILIARKCYSCIYRFCCSLVTKLGSNGCLEVFMPARVCALEKSEGTRDCCEN
jgi:hypothetical protein